jgi:prepilin-type N-terminal cleavage/methylation domain-containing protein
MKQRKGFTLIELMIVIAIIIILAAIAIPNYLRMTERAKKARISSDMASLATGLEAFKTDWGAYPKTTKVPVDVAGNVLYGELTGTSGAVTNVTGHTTITGEQGPVEYIKPATLTSIVDPFILTGGTDSDGHIYYYSANGGQNWVLYAYSTGATGAEKYLYRSDGSSTVGEDTLANIATTTGYSVVP